MKYTTIDLSSEMYDKYNGNLTQALEEIDNSSQYKGTPSADLDAFERQLKRFDIRVQSTYSESSKLKEFFRNNQTLILLPEYIRRKVTSNILDIVKNNCFSMIELTEEEMKQDLIIAPALSKIDENTFSATVAFEPLNKIVGEIVINRLYFDHSIEFFNTALKQICIEFLKKKIDLKKFSNATVYAGIKVKPSIDYHFTYSNNSIDNYSDSEIKIGITFSYTAI